MDNEQNKNNKLFFRHKSFKKTVYGSLIVALITLIITMIVKGKSVRIKDFSDGFFISANIFLILGVFLRLKAWRIHKKSLSKRKKAKENSTDPALENEVLRFAAKSFGFIGLINIVLSLLFLVFYYF